MDSASRHALVFGLDDDAHAFRLQNVLDAIGYLCRHLFLHLKAAGKGLDHARQFADAHNLVIWKIANVCFADNWGHMVFAMRFECDVAKYDHLVVTFNLFECTFKVGNRILVVTAEPVLVGFCYAHRRVYQTFATGIFSSPKQ